jgi:heat shock protein HslJ
MLGMMRALRLLVLPLALLGLVSCGSDSKASSTTTPTSLANSAWTLSGDGGTVFVPVGSGVGAAFTDTAISGNSGCNSFSGTYLTTAGRGLTISGLAGTKMACDAKVMTFETEYLARLGRVASYEIKGNVLRMLDGNGTLILTYLAKV